MVKLKLFYLSSFHLIVLIETLVIFYANLLQNVRISFSKNVHLTFNYLLFFDDWKLSSLIKQVHYIEERLRNPLVDVEF